MASDWPDGLSNSAVDAAGEVLRRSDATAADAPADDAVRQALERLKAFRRRWTNTGIAWSTHVDLLSRARDAGVAVVDHASRVKRVERIVAKLKRENIRRLSTLRDIGGVRFVLPDEDGVAHMRRVVEAVAAPKVHRVLDYVRRPRPTGYRAVHVELKESIGLAVEVQLRTWAQNEWANAVESFERPSGALLKGGEGPPAVLERFAQGAAEVAELEPGDRDAQQRAIEHMIRDVARLLR